MSIPQSAAQATASSPSQPTIVNVGLGARAYDIVIGRGVLSSLGARIAALRPGVRTAVVTDRSVAKHWLAATEASLAGAGVPTSKIVVGEGEGTKSYAVLEEVSEALIDAKVERNDLVIAIGGGVIGDLAGFAAAAVRPRRPTRPRSCARAMSAGTERGTRTAWRASRSRWERASSRSATPMTR